MKVVLRTSVLFAWSTITNAVPIEMSIVSFYLCIHKVFLLHYHSSQILSLLLSWISLFTPHICNAAFLSFVNKYLEKYAVLSFISELIYNQMHSVYTFYQ